MTDADIGEVHKEQEKIMGIYEEEGYIIKAHNSGTEKMHRYDWAVVRLYELDKAGNVRGLELCPVATFSFVTCLNPLYVGKDGHVHLSTCSVGGNLWNMDIERYNREFSPENDDGYHVNQRVELVYDPTDYFASAQEVV